MRENKLLEALALLGLYEGTVIDVKGFPSSPYTIVGDGLENKYGILRNDLIGELLSGKFDFDIVSWEPNNGDVYYFIAKRDIQCKHWQGAIFDLSFKDLGNCFPTRMAAEAGKAKLFKRIGYAEVCE